LAALLPGLDLPLDEVLDAVCSELANQAAWLDIPGDFPESAADLLSQSGLTALCLPRRFGGRGGGLSDLVTAVERVATVDGGTAWCLFLLGTAPWFLCRARPELVREVYARPDSRVAGALAPTGVARRHRDGYMVTGHWTFGSAVNACGWVAVHAMLADDATPRSGFILVPVTEISYREVWDGLGMVSSGSGAFRIADLFVPEHRLIDSLSSAPTWPDPAFRVPFRATFAACAAVLLGIATDMLTSFIEYAKQKRPAYGHGVLAEYGNIKMLVAESWGQLHAARSLLYLTVGNLERACADGELGLMLEAELRIAMINVRESCLAVVDRLHLAAGGSAARSESRFARLLRDAHTASQHHMFSGTLQELAGSVLLGREVPDGQL
jgi:alkylation response protein AidB-like acyl-CoA dehydrogenase